MAHLVEDRDVIKGLLTRNTCYVWGHFMLQVINVES